MHSQKKYQNLKKDSNILKNMAKTSKSTKEVPELVYEQEMCAGDSNQEVWALSQCGPIRRRKIGVEFLAKTL